MSTISNNINQMRKLISSLEKRYERAPGSVDLLAVSKTKPLSAVIEAIECGQRQFGENYLSDALGKIPHTAGKQCDWHFIGHIQSNKTRQIAENFSWVHTLEREKIAERLSAQRPKQLPALNCCIQVNIDNEPSKSGVSVAELPHLLDSIYGLPQLKIRGLMVIPATRTRFEAQRDVFATTRQLFESLKASYPDLDTLSMGMSGDMEAAIAEGATMVRIGTALFGERDAQRR